ncbi:hypothetical protein [Nocardioides acrostichi]|uniref:hypothetical protein n=1 Tax=Nocardioides acrostichi TaxID=2784339 RepID=UPI00188D1BC4|nr:hypothetical protein [Nocardioides acrostichi]
MGTAATAAAGTVAMIGGGSASAATPRGGRAQEPVVAHVADPASDVLTLMVGEHEVEVRDRDLVVRLLNAAGGR